MTVHVDNELRYAGPTAFRTYALEKKCEVHEQHAHNYDHSIYVIEGAVRVLDDEGRPLGEYGKGQVGCVKAGVRHTVKALADGTLYHCVFSHRDLGGMVTQTYAGNIASYV